MERTCKICVLKTTSKMLDWCNIWPFYHDFHRLKSSYLFFISRILYKILDEVKLKEIVFDNFLLSIIHVFRGFFRSILWSCFYYGILLNPKSRAHFCSDWVYSSFAVIFFLVHYLMFSLRPSTIWLRSCLMACRLVSVSKRTWYGGIWSERSVISFVCLFWCFTSHSRILGHHYWWRDPNSYLNNTNGLWAMAFFLRATPTVTMDICLFNTFELVFSLCHKWNKYNCKPYKMLNHAGNRCITRRIQLCHPPDTVTSHRRQLYQPLVYLFCIFRIRSGSWSFIAV